MCSLECSWETEEEEEPPAAASERWIWPKGSLQAEQELPGARAGHSSGTTEPHREKGSPHRETEMDPQNLRLFSHLLRGILYPVLTNI